MTIGKRIGLGFGLILLMITATSIMNYRNSVNIEEGIKMSDERFEQLSLFTEFKYRFKETTLAYMDAIVDSQSGAVDQDIKDLHSDFKSYVESNKQKFIASVDTNEEQENLKNIFKNIETYLEAGEGLIASIEAKKITEEDLSKFDNVIDDLADKTADLIAANVISIKNEYHESSMVLKNSNEKNLSFQTWSFFMIMLFCLGFTYFFTQNVTQLLSAITNKLSKSSSQTADVSLKVANSSAELSTGSAAQAAAIQEASSSLEEVSGMVKKNVFNVEKTVELSNKMLTISKEGDDSMANLMKSMDNILASNEKIEDFVKIIGDIGEKTKVMDEIVFQTKLLSFNASVEAERAGEHGRGFAVVAQEVGNLAKMSGAAANEIAQIVKKSIEGANTITNENKKRVQEGNNYAAKAVAVLKEITKSSQTAFLEQKKS